MRTIISVEDNKIKELDKICTRLKISRAEAIRQAIDLFTKSAGDNLGDFFNKWHDRKIDGLEFQKKLRREWK